MLRVGSRASSPYSAADSKPMNETYANISISPTPLVIPPCRTVDGVNDSSGSACVPSRTAIAMSRTSRIATSRATRTPSTFADRSTER